MSSLAKSFCQSIFPWLKMQLGPRCLAPLTSHDYAALQAAVQIAALWARGDCAHRRASAQAFGLCVRQMQEHVWHFAFHSVAHVADWSHRWQLWREAGLPEIRPPCCKFGPQPAPTSAPASA